VSHVEKARALGISIEDVMLAVTTAENVKAAKASLDAKPKTSGCCGPAKAVESAPKEKGAKQADGCCRAATNAAETKSGGCC
jgi:hypothetical protein